MTIYALSSGPGMSGIAVIRVSGKNTAEVIKKLTRSKLPPPRVATLKKFNKNGKKDLIDEGVIIWFPGPNSYTGEDLAEFHVHGSRAVIRVSGKNTAEVIKKLTGSKLPTPRVATLKKFNKNGGKELIDEGVIIWFPGPNSYTGEDLAEFHVHGSRAVVNAMHLAISKIKNCRFQEWLLL